MRKLFLLILIIFISQINSKFLSLEEDKIDIKIISISLPQVPCTPSLATYLFNINCNFSKVPLITQTITLSLSSNIKSLCYPLESTEVSDSILQCEINIVDYPINNQNIFLPLEPPESDYYTFNNWKEIIAAQPDISNKISDKEISCLPKALNSFVINDYSNQGCINDNNYITLIGKWNDENILMGKKFEFDFEKIKGQCLYYDINRIQCEIEGSGELFFENDLYFKYGINPYKIDKSDKKYSIIDCNSYFNDSLSRSFSLIIFGLIMILLF